MKNIALSLLTAILASPAVAPLRAETRAAHAGIVEYAPAADEAIVPERFRLPAHTFQFHETPLGEMTEDLAISLVEFPSPVTTPHEVNNTVHCEYYRPLGADAENAAPGVIVLHILGGDFELARLFCNALAHRGTAALFVKMPYYGPRRAADSQRRMISPDPRQTVEGMTQAVLDIRRAAAWLGSRPEVDEDDLGVFGISLGGIIGALAMTAEPRLQSGCLLLAGGDIGRVAWEAPELEKVRSQWTEQGGTKDEFLAILKTVDPARYAANARGRRILMLNAKDDEVIPHACTLSLWKAFGEPEIIWYDGGHYGVVRHIFSALSRTTRFFEKDHAQAGAQ
ncbi:MAG: alpha/beta hydrolase family protein [Planctomycetes bacterium]|nr:alpha/beta hydrolase family protein [Planctomycetota bacterium]